MAGDAFHLTVETACAYLRDTGRLPDGEPCTAAALGGGVSNEVVLVESPAGRWVLKQALPRLRVAAEWLADAGRSEVEARCLEALRPLLPAGAVPPLLFTDPERHILAMGAAPTEARNLKHVLLGGEVDHAAVAMAGTMLGAIQAGTRGRADVEADFGDLLPFRQLRIDPYYLTAAARNADVAAVVLESAREVACRKQCLVHGDYSPKNMLINGGCVMLLDFEVAHWGCRAFDPAFFLTHLALKCIHLPRRAREFASAALGFWAAYLAAAAWPDGAAIEAEAVVHWGCLLLARVDGKSPAEYIRSEGAKQAVRTLATAVLEGRLQTIDAVLNAVNG